MLIDQGEFDTKLEEILERMGREGALVPYLVGLGDVWTEIAEDLNNEVINAILRERGEEVEDDDE